MKFFSILWEWIRSKYLIYEGFFEYCRVISEIKEELDLEWDIEVDNAYRMHMLFKPSEQAVDVYGKRLIQEELKSKLGALNKYMHRMNIADMIKRERIFTLNPEMIVVILGYRYGSNTRIMTSVSIIGVVLLTLFLLLIIKLIF